MKERNLMIGDLVYNHRKWICRVVAVDKEHVTVIARHYGECPYKWEDIQPIPMSEEIITQLGWKEIKKGDPDYKVVIGLKKAFKHPWYEKSLNISQNSLTDMYWFHDVYIKHLHVLQHALYECTKDQILLEDENDNKVYIKNHHIWEDNLD